MAPQGSSVAPSQPALRIPSEAEVAQMSARQQRAYLRRALARLDEELDELSTGASWKTFLQTSDLGRALWSGPESEPLPDADTRVRLRTVAERFARVAQQPQFRAVGGLAGFQLVHAVLPEYATGEVERSQRSLRTASAALVDSLGRLNTGPGWKAHLQTDELHRLGRQADPPQPADTEILRGIAEKFAKVAANPDYRQIAGAAGFAASRAAVERLVKAHEEEQAALAKRGAGPPPARPEATHLERMVVSLLHDYEQLHHLCAEENRASVTVLTLRSAQSAPATGDTLELVRQVQSANDVLRQIKEQHDAAARAAEERLRGLLKAFQTGTTRRLAGQPVMILPLDAPPPKDSVVVEIMQFTDEPSKGTTVEIMPLGVEPPKDKDKSAEILPLGVAPPKEKDKKASQPEPK
jgi:hypothetical protein